MAAVLEYLTAEILELAGNEAKSNKKVRIRPQDILKAIKNDQELQEIFAGELMIAEGGHVPKSIIRN
jgi:histone H2A